MVAIVLVDITSLHITKLSMTPRRRGLLFAAPEHLETRSRSRAAWDRGPRNTSPDVFGDVSINQNMVRNKNDEDPLILKIQTKNDETWCLVFGVRLFIRVEHPLQNFVNNWPFGATKLLDFLFFSTTQPKSSKINKNPFSRFLNFIKPTIFFGILVAPKHHPRPSRKGPLRGDAALVRGPVAPAAGATAGHEAWKAWQTPKNQGSETPKKGGKLLKNPMISQYFSRFSLLLLLLLLLFYFWSFWNLNKRLIGDQFC